MIITRAISLTNFLVATSALEFQVFVLYLWHKQTDDDFEKLKTKHLHVLHTINRIAESPPPIKARELERGSVYIARSSEGTNLWRSFSALTPFQCPRAFPRSISIAFVFTSRYGYSIKSRCTRGFDCSLTRQSPLLFGL